jgi:hypothetical protein
MDRLDISDSASIQKRLGRPHHQRLHRGIGGDGPQGCLERLSPCPIPGPRSGRAKGRGDPVGAPKAASPARAALLHAGSAQQDFRRAPEHEQQRRSRAPASSLSTSASGRSTSGNVSGPQVGARSTAPSAAATPSRSSGSWTSCWRSHSAQVSSGELARACAPGPDRSAPEGVLALRNLRQEAPANAARSPGTGPPVPAAPATPPPWRPPPHPPPGPMRTIRALRESSPASDGPTTLIAAGRSQTIAEWRSEHCNDPTVFRSFNLH